MRKPAFCICENKDADQLRGKREADQRLCFRYTDSTIPLLPKSEISSLTNNLLWLNSPVCVGPGRKPRRPVFSERGSYDPWSEAPFPCKVHREMLKNCRQCRALNTSLLSLQHSLETTFFHSTVFLNTPLTNLVLSSFYSPKIFGTFYDF